MDGLEGDTRDARAGLFGENIINIEEKPIIKLLVDEAPPTPSSTGLTLYRFYIHSTSSKFSPLSYGPWTNTTTTPPVSF